MSKLAQARIDGVVTCHICGEDLPLAGLPASCGEGLWRHPECEMPKPQVVKVTAEPRRVPTGVGEALMRQAWGDAVSLVRSDFPEASYDAAVESASRIAIALFERTIGGTHTERK